jgi:hypothetical protein
LYLALNKGGVFKLFRGGKLVTSDTQLSLLVSSRRRSDAEEDTTRNNIGERDGGNVVSFRAEVSGKIKNAVGHLIGDYETNVRDDEITIRGSLGWAKQKQMTTARLIILRMFMITAGRFFPNLVRKLLQKMLITGKEIAPFTFTRTLEWNGDSLRITDELRARSWDYVISAGIGCDQTSIYVVMSRTFQPGQLQPWLDLTDEVKKLRPGQPLRVERVF